MFSDEIVKLQRQRSVYLDFSQANNMGVEWTGEVVRLYGVAPDDLGPYPIRGNVLSFGSFSRAVLNMELDLETPSVTVTLADENNQWRVLGEPPSQQILYRWVHLMLRVMDDTGGFFEQRVAVGQITEPKFPPNKQVSLTLELNTGQFLGEMIPRRLVTMRDFPRCPPENVGKAVPFVYGVRSNAVLTAGTPVYATGRNEFGDFFEVSAGKAFRSSAFFTDSSFQFDVLIEDASLSPNGYVAAASMVSVANVVNSGTITGAASNIVVHSSFGDGPPIYQFGGSTAGAPYRVPDNDPINGTTVAGTVPRVGWAWHTISIHARTSTKVVIDPAQPVSEANTSFAPDGIIEARYDGGVVVRVEGLTLPVYGGGILRVEFGDHSPDMDDIWISSTFDGSVRDFAENFDAMPGGVGTGNPYRGGHVLTDGGASGSNYWSDATSSSVLGGGAGITFERTWGGTGETAVPGCTPSTTGTGPNMTAGALRALLVDTGVTTVVTVQNPAPEPGMVTLDTSIEQMGTAFANERIGSGSINVPTFFFVAPLFGNRVGPLSAIMDLDQGYDPDYPSHDAVVSWNDLTTGTPDQWIVWMFTDFNFHPVSNPGPGARVRIIAGTPYTDPDYPPGNTYDYQVVFTSVDDGDPWEQFIPLPPGGGGTTTTSAFSGYRYLLTGHTLHRVNEVYVRRPVPVPSETEGGDPTTLDMQVLQQEGTDFVQEVIEVNGNRYHTIRFFGAQQSDDCTTQFEVTANVEGVETNGDGTGLLITNALEVVEHILLNWVFNDYRSSVGVYAPQGGRWFTDVPYAPGLINHASFVAAQEASYTYVVNGYQGSGALTEQITSTQLVTDLVRSFGLDFFYDPDRGWWAKIFLPDSVLRASLTELHPDPPNVTSYVGIMANSFSQTIERTHRNVIPYLAGPMEGRLADAGGNEDGGYTVSGVVSDPESIRVYGQTIAAEPIILPWTADPETAYSVAYRFLRLVRFPALMAQCRTPLGALNVPLASEVAVTHPDGIGSLTGWTRRVCRVYRQDIDLDRMEMVLTLRDVDGLVP